MICVWCYNLNKRQNRLKVNLYTSNFSIVSIIYLYAMQYSYTWKYPQKYLIYIAMQRVTNIYSHSMTFLFYWNHFTLLRLAEHRRWKDNKNTFCDFAFSIKWYRHLNQFIELRFAQTLFSNTRTISCQTKYIKDDNFLCKIYLIV